MAVDHSRLPKGKGGEGGREGGREAGSVGFCRLGM